MSEKMNKLNSYFELTYDYSKGEVFTPDWQAQEIVEKIYELHPYVFISNSTTFCNPACSYGIFIIALVNKLMECGHSEANAKSRVYGYDTRHKYINRLKRRGYRVYNKNILDGDLDMKFDVEVGNYPFSMMVGPDKKKDIWNEFPVSAINDRVKKGGILAPIHPSSWRNPDGGFTEVEKTLRSRQIQYLEMHNKEDGIKTFKSRTTYDWYVVKNELNDGSSTILKLQDGKEVNINLSDFKFIPSGNIDKVKKQIAKENEDTVEVLHSWTSYETRNTHMNKEESEVFKYPCVNLVRVSGEPKLMWSSINSKGHFGIPKLIWGNGGYDMGSFLDENGEYGLTQFSYGIVDTLENLKKIKKVFDSQDFRNMMKSCDGGNDNINRRALSLFKKDFWKEFV
ncbi:hypothetical protein HOE22_07395 [Candidatus Woesearchaeota archaeon]|jgi:hypothetical protein|nr:hypothetical protein [Candidatus Woesearchaeota archaeon]